MAPKASARWRFRVAVAILCAPPLVLGILGTRNLEWPDDPDLFRESAQAQSFADGHLLDDPYYLGEWIWYPPWSPRSWPDSRGSPVLPCPRSTRRPVPI